MSQIREPSQQLGDAHGMAATYNDLGGVYRYKGEWDRAIEFFQKALKISEKLEEIQIQGQTFGNLGSVYAQMAETLSSLEEKIELEDLAIEFFQKDIGICERLGDRQGMVTTYLNLGRVYLNKKKNALPREKINQFENRAVEYYQKSLTLSEQLGDIYGQIEACDHLRIIYLERRDWGHATEILQKSLIIKTELEDMHGVGYTFGDLAIIYYRQGDIKQAAYCAAQACLVFSQLGTSLEAQKAGRLLADILGSVEIAKAYLAQMMDDEESSTMPSQEDDDFTLEDLFDDMIQACRGDAELGEQLWQYTQEIAGDTSLPSEMRTLGRILTLILAGERSPDLVGLSPEVAGAVREMLEEIKK